MNKITMETTIHQIREKIIAIPNCPKDGVTFRDISPLLFDNHLRETAFDILADKCKDMQIDIIAGLDARGFIVATALASRSRLSKSLIMIRKSGKLPCKTIKADYELEYGKNSIEVQEGFIKSGSKVLIVDDILATGGTLEAACYVVTKAGGKVVGIANLIEIYFEGAKQRLNQYVPHENIKCVVTFA